VKTKSTEPSKRFLVELTVRTEAPEISVYQWSHAADFSQPHRHCTPVLLSLQPQIRWHALKACGCRF
jgi:hypothetical protein